MKAKILQKNFSKALNSVGRIVGSRTTLPVLSNILISAEKGKLMLAATDLEVAVTTDVVGKVESDGKITVPARVLTDFVTNNKDENIDLELKEKLTLQLKSKHYEANIKGIDAEEFPSIPKLDKGESILLDAEKFSRSLQQVVMAAANDDTRPVLAGVYMKFGGKSLTMAATDSYRLAETKTALEEGIEDRELIVPSRTMNEVFRLVSSTEGVEKVEIKADENQICFILGKVEVISRLIEGAFPNYSGIIPTESKIEVVANLSELTSAIKMSALFAKDVANNIKINVGKNGVVIKSTSEQTGDTTSKLTANVSGGEIEIAFNARYLLDVLGVLPEGEIKLQFNDESSPGVIKSDKEKEYIYLVMPLKVDN